MNIRYCIFILFLAITSTAVAQYNELKEFGLKDSIKSVTTFMYTAWDENGTPDTTQLFYKTYRHFNTDGMVDYYSTAYSSQETFFDGITFLSSNLSFYFDSTGLKQGGTGITTRYYGDSVVEVSHEIYTYEWLSPYDYYERSQYELLANKRMEQRLILDSTFFIIRVDFTAFNDDGTVDYNYVTTYTKNENGFIAGSLETGTYMDEDVVQTYTYQQYDTRGNPTLLTVHTAGKPADSDLLVIKVYEYYEAGE